MNHGKQIIVNCWKCGKTFDVVTAKRCYEHLNGDRQGNQQGWTTKCAHCGACICHKVNKMKDIKCEVLNNAGIMRVMPSVHKQLTNEVQEN